MKIKIYEGKKVNLQLGITEERSNEIADFCFELTKSTTIKAELMQGIVKKCKTLNEVAFALSMAFSMVGQHEGMHHANLEGMIANLKQNKSPSALLN